MPGEDDTTDPDNDYTDPDTGEPVAPTPGAGNLLALHDGGLSYSENGGHTWHAAANTPALPLDISALTDGVLIRATDGRASTRPTRWPTATCQEPMSRSIWTGPRSPTWFSSTAISRRAT